MAWTSSRLRRPIKGYYKLVSATAQTRRLNIEGMEAALHPNLDPVYAGTTLQALHRAELYWELVEKSKP